MRAYDVIGRGAVFGPGGESSEYRYELARELAPSFDTRPGKVAWIMLNPSTATATLDDPTIRRCMGFTAREGYADLTIVNLYALRSPNPDDLRLHDAPWGPDNDDHIVAVAECADVVICAWGSHSMAPPRAAAVMRMLDGVDLWCLGVNADGQPKHPLYVPGSAPVGRYYDPVGVRP